MYNEFYKATNKIYSLLEDDESREIFMAKLMFYSSSDYKYIFDMVEKYTELSTEDFSWSKLIIKAKEYIKAGKEPVIYGAGGEGKGLQNILKLNGIMVDRFVDRNYQIINKSNVISPNQLLEEYHNNHKIFIIIGTEMYYFEIYNYLINNNVFADDILGGAANLKKQYFDEKIIKYVPDEVFVDCGSLNFMTCQYFENNCDTQIRKMIAFEPDNNNYVKCLEVAKASSADTKIYPYGVYSENGQLSFINESGGTSRISADGTDSVEVRKLDDLLADDKVTFIKMDIEGAELEALKGAEQIIKTCRPKLAISVYHKSEDIVEIPMYLHSILPEYKFYIRHYSIYSVETVLYAII